MATLEPLIKELETIALAGGATAVKFISPQDVVVAQWVRNKCQFGCRRFGQRFTCPPYSPTPEETAKTLPNYDKAVLIEFGNLQDQTWELSRKTITDTLGNIERTAFLSGCERAFSYKAGPCILCPDCPAENLESPNLFSKKECRYPKEARPSMEAAGIDVYSTVRQAGFEIHVVRDRTEPFKCFGLVLLE